MPMRAPAPTSRRGKTPPPPPPLPVLVVFDVDETLVGDVSPLLDYGHLISHVVDQCRLNVKATCRASGLIPAADKPASARGGVDGFRQWKDWVRAADFASLSRPHTRELLDALEALAPGRVEFFVYSAGHRDYIEALIPPLERHLGVRFHRPLLAREDCYRSGVSLMKSIDLRRGRIEEALARKYDGSRRGRAPLSPEDLDLVFRERLLVIDDNNVWDDRDGPRHVLCPHYRFQPVVSIPGARVPVLAHPDVQAARNEFPGLVPELPAGATPEESLASVYLSRAVAYQAAVAPNREARRDDFFRRLARALRAKRFAASAHPFSEKNVCALRRAVSMDGTNNA